MKFDLFLKGRLGFHKFFFFLFVYEQTFHIPRVRISQKLNSSCNTKPLVHHFYVKLKIMVDIHIWIRVALMEYQFIFLLNLNYK